MKRFLRAAALVLAVAFVLIVIFHTAILSSLGNFLVKAGPPQKAEMVVVLAGDGFGNRVLKAAELVKEGWAPKVLVSGPDGSYGNYECDLAIPFAVKAGYPEAWFVHAEHRARSTAEEARFLDEKLRAMGVRRIILVTSDYHTRRSGKIFHRLAPDLEVYVVAAPDSYFNPDRWWHNREASKIFVLEWTKTIVEW